MNKLYVDREQTQAKHEILKRYLVPFSNKILRTWPSLDFIDAFSGPWQNRDTLDLSDTSIGIALETFSSIAQSLDHSTSDPKIRCIFNEADPTSFSLLNEYVDRNRSKFPLIKVEVFQGRFSDNALAIKATANHAFQLLFVDPTGYKGMPPATLQIFQGRSTEIIVNFMRSFINRFVSSQHEDRDAALVELLGTKRAHYLLQTGLSIEAVEREYLSMLRGTLKYEFAAHSPIHNPDKNEVHFNLAYATNHYEGMDVMRRAEYGALSEYDRQRFLKTQSDETPSLFAEFEADLEVLGPYLKKRKQHLTEAPDTIREILASHPKGMKFGHLAATAQQSLFLKRSEIGDCICKLAASSEVEPTWKSRNKSSRKPHVDDLIHLKL